MENNQVTSTTSTFKTFAFFDLETSGLLGVDKTRTKITQLSLLACSVQHIMELKDTNTIPRVHHKLTLCFNPRKLIKLDCSAITGLTNELLEHERKFDENTVDLIINFLSHLQQPVCLVAHNGNRFDYPLLKSHCQALNKSLPESLICCDSLDIFRKIDEIYEQNSKTLINGFKLTSWEKIQTKAMLMMDSEILEIEEVLRNYESDGEELTVSQLETSFLSHQTVKSEPAEDEISERQRLNETTPSKPIKNELNNPPSKQQLEHNNKRASNGARKELFPETSEKSPTISKNGKKIFPKGYYTLREIYKRYFDEYPENSHDAESDTVALLKCVCASRKEFLDVAMATAYNFSNVKA